MASVGGLMPHQKDEHDIWICKDCGWRYPNARPSPKIRKNHKKHCPKKAGTEAHATGGSSDDVSDDDHHLPLRGNGAPKEVAAGAPDAQPESMSRNFDLALLKENLKSEASPVAAPFANGAAKEAPAPKDATSPAVTLSALMPHQKDEHDIWICKDCGWKYPNARPSPKIRKNHKKHCPAKGGSVVPGGSSDEASDYDSHQALAIQAVAAESGWEVHGSTITGPAEPFKEFDLAALTESPSPDLVEATSTDISPDAGIEAEESTPSASGPVRLENGIAEQPPDVVIAPAVEPEKEDRAAVCDVPGKSTRERDFAAPKKSLGAAVTHKTCTASSFKTSPGVPGGKRTTLQIKQKPPWRY